MESISTIAAVTPVLAAAPPPAESDGRAPADAIATKTDPTPDVPLPMPANPVQTGLVTKAALSDKDTAPQLDTTGGSSAERSLKPYGINMLPEKTDAPKQETPQDSPT